jgi:uncharacterized protein YndB with AHSA1/START domain
MMGRANPQFTISRTFDAPLALVWEAYTELEHLSKWWGPKGFEWISGTLDFRPGGRFHYGMRAPTGMEMWGRFDYREIEPMKRIAFTNSFSDKDGNTIRAPFPNMENFPLRVMNNVVFTESGGKTTLHMTGTPFEASDTEKSFYEGMFPSMNQGFTGTLNQLDEYLETMRR